MATVLVIDESVSVRQTLQIVLGHEHDVVSRPSLADGGVRGANVVVLGLPPSPRDEHALGAALARTAPDVPLLLLHAVHDVDVHALVPPHVPVEFLPKPFDAYAVRARVRTLLAGGAPAAGATAATAADRRFLEFPFLTQASAAVVRRVLTADVPVVLLQGEPGTGAPQIARALHGAASRRGSFVMLDVGRLAAGELLRGIGPAIATARATLFLANLDRADAAVQVEVLELVASRVAAPGSSLRLIVGARDDLGAMAAAGDVLPELAYVATTVPIVLTPLRERTEDLPALVRVVTDGVCARLRMPAPTFSAAALERLRHYLWFGNVAELEAVLARTLVLARPTIVEARDLVFLPEGAADALAPRTAIAAPTSHAVAGLADLDLEVVLNELAHELRNPMVTIKTFAQHLDGVLADPESRTRFAALTTEAIGRMDELLETLLEFSRFRDPQRRPVDLQVQLDRALAEHASELARRHVAVERNGVGAGTVEADEDQVGFALRSLFRGLVPDLVAEAPILMRAAAPGAVELQVRTDSSTAARLAAWVEPRNGRHSETPPLAWALAAAVLARNGGSLAVRPGESGGTVIRIGWTDRAA